MVTFYASATELRAYLGRRGLSDGDVNSGVVAWRDAPRAMASLSARVTIPAPRVVRAPSSGGVPPAPKLRTRTRPTKRRTPRHVEEQGFEDVDSKVLDAVWRMVVEAGPQSDLYHRHSDPRTTEMAKTLFLRPLRRFKDSVGARLAVWRR